MNDTTVHPFIYVQIVEKVMVVGGACDYRERIVSTLPAPQVDLMSPPPIIIIILTSSFQVNL